MKEKKQFIFIISIIFIIIVLIFAVFYFKTNKNSNIVSNISDINEAYDVKVCVNKFYEYCKEYRDTAPKAIYELLDDDYINYYELNEKNFIKNLDIVDSNSLYIDSVYKLKQKRNLSLYLIKATQLYRNSDETKTFNVILKLDRKNNTFSIFLNDYINDNNYTNLNLGEKVKISLKNIKEKTNNTFDSSEKQIYDNVQDIFSSYQSICIFYKKYAYTKLSAESKDEEFTDYEIFNSYINSKFKDIITMKLLYYEKMENGEEIEYKIYDDKNINFSFKVTSYITYDVIIKDN